MKKLFFVRHGLSQANLDDKFAGRLDSPLTKAGKHQATKAGAELVKRGQLFDLIISSPLSRARHTAEYIAGQIGYPIDKIELNELFIERAWGVLEGTSVQEFKDKYPKQGSTETVQDVETLVELQKRAQAGLAYLQAKQEDNILVVSHGSYGRALTRVVNGLPHTHEYSKDAIHIGNCEIVELI